MRYLDAAVGDIIFALKQNGMWKDTLLFATTDNGGMPPVPFLSGQEIAFGAGNNWPLRAGKMTLFEGGVRGVGGITGGRLPIPLRGVNNTKTLLHAIDVVLTMLAAAGIEVPENVDGIDIFSNLAGEGHDHLFLRLNRNITAAGIALPDTGALRRGPMKYIYGFQAYGDYYDTTVQKWRVSNMIRDGERCIRGCLFNVETDPFERVNLIDDPTYALVLNIMKSMIALELKYNYVENQNFDIIHKCLPENFNGSWMPCLTDEDIAAMGITTSDSYSDFDGTMPELTLDTAVTSVEITPQIWD